MRIIFHVITNVLYNKSFIRKWHIFIWTAGYTGSIRIIIKFTQQLLMFIPNTKFHQSPFGSFRGVPCSQMDVISFVCFHFMHFVQRAHKRWDLYCFNFFTFCVCPQCVDEHLNIIKLTSHITSEAGLFRTPRPSWQGNTNHNNTHYDDHYGCSYRYNNVEIQPLWYPREVLVDRCVLLLRRCNGSYNIQMVLTFLMWILAT